MLSLARGKIVVQRLSRLYVSHFGSPTAWYDHLLFDLDDPDTHEPTDVVFNLENAGGKTSLLAYLFSCFDPKQERWLQHLQKKNHRFAEYFARDGRPSFLVMEWKMPARSSQTADYRLIIGQSVAVRDSTERGAEVERWFFAFVATDGLVLESLPVTGFSSEPVRTMHEFVQWMHQAAKRSNGDFFQTKTQDDWVKHLGNTRLLDIELLRMQVDFNSTEGGMEEGFLTFNSELDLLRRLLALTLDIDKCVTVRDAVAQTADKLRSKPKYERRLVHLTRLQSCMLPFAESAHQYESARDIQHAKRRALGGLARALTRRADAKRDSSKQSLDYARTQESIAESSADTTQHHQNENTALEGLLLERQLNSATQLERRQADVLAQANHRLRCLEGAQAWVHFEATRTRLDELDALLESEREGLKPARQHAEIQGALLRSALTRTAHETRANAIRAAELELSLKSQIEGIQRERSGIEKRLRELSAEAGQLTVFEESCQRRREQLLLENVLTCADRDAQSAIDRLTLQLEERRFELASLREAEDDARQAERTERDLASGEALKAQEAKAAQDSPRIFLAAGEALRDELRQSPVLCTAADTSSPDPDAPPLIEALNRLISDAHREIADRNVRLAQLGIDRTSILETGLAGRNPNVDAVVRALQGGGVRSARATNTYLAEVRPHAEEARALVLSDPARYLGVTVAQAEWPVVATLAKTLNVRLSAPVKVAVSSVQAGAQGVDAFVLPAQDDSAYNKQAASTLRANLDERIANTEEERKAYEERRDQGSATRERLQRYLKDYGATRLRQAQALIDELHAENEAALSRHAEHLTNADRFLAESAAIAVRTTALPKQIALCEGSIRRAEDFQREFEAELDTKRARQSEVRALLEQEQTLIETLDLRREDLETFKENAMRDRMRLENETTTLVQETAQITYWDSYYPADEQLLARPRGIETLRVTYADAVATLLTQERDRLGSLAARLEQARENCTKAEQDFAGRFSDLSREMLEPFESVDFPIALPDQRATVGRVEGEYRAAEIAVADAKSAHRTFWTGKKSLAVDAEVGNLTDTAVRERINTNAREIERLTDLVASATLEAQRARAQAATANQEVSQLDALSSALVAAVPLDDIEPISIVLPEEFASFTTNSISEFQSRQRQLQTLQETARKAFRVLTDCAVSREFAEAEPELSREVTQSDFDLACTDRARLVDLIADRISATQDTLDGMQPDFENCVGEIYNLTYEAIRLLTRACSITMPSTTPYVGGKPILKMRAAFASISVEARKGSIRQYLNTLIDSGVIPARGADLIANGVVAISARSDLGLELLKMEQNEAYQYQLASELKGSKGQGSVIAMFLYLLISQLRASMQARAKRGGGGPLILDNPFAKVQTRALVDAQRLLAKEIGVQLIFFTANADYNMLSGFRRVIRLRKAGAHSKSGRSHIEMVSAAFTDPSIAGEATHS